MRCFLVIGLLLLFAGCQRALDPPTVSAFQQAQQAFDQATSPTEYLLAASQLQQLVDQGVRSGAVYYNLGNAYMRGGQRGRAIACYRQAERYLPRDPRLNANLRFALGDNGALGPRSLLEYVFFWQDWVSYPGKFRLSLAMAASTLALGVVSLFLPGKWWRRAATGLLVATIVLGCSALYDWYRFEQVRRGVVTVAETVPRKGNSASYEPALTAPLAEGAEFVVLEQRSEWLLVRLAEGQEGWLPAGDVVTY